MRHNAQYQRRDLIAWLNANMSIGERPLTASPKSRIGIP
jgi:hypothetical protein